MSTAVPFKLYADIPLDNFVTRELCGIIVMEGKIKVDIPYKFIFKKCPSIQDTMDAIGTIFMGMYLVTRCDIRRVGELPEWEVIIQVKHESGKRVVGTEETNDE